MGSLAAADGEFFIEEVNLVEVQMLTKPQLLPTAFCLLLTAFLFHVRESLIGFGALGGTIHEDSNFFQSF